MVHLQIKSKEIKPYLKNPLKIFGLIWHLYNIPFDRQLSEIQDLNIFVKISSMSLLIVALLLGLTTSVTNGVREPGNLATAIGAIILVILMIFWMGYLPFLLYRITNFYYKKFFGKN